MSDIIPKPPVYTQQEAAAAFEWLRKYALMWPGQREAGIALTEWARVSRELTAAIERAEKAEMELESLRKSFAVTEQCLGEDRDQWREVAGRLYELAYPKLIMPEATPVYRAYEEMVASENGGNNG